MNYLVERNQRPVLFLNNNNEEVCDSKLIANDFNDYFVNIGPNLAKKKKINRDNDLKVALVTPVYKASEENIYSIL